VKPRAVSPFRSARGAAARLAGHRREIVAALWLMLKGYRILGFRLRTPQGEIDLLAQKGRTLAVVEVKSRVTLEEALGCVTHAQRERLRRAARAVASRRPSLRSLSVRLDLIAMGAGGRPRHIANAWNEADSG
jgi:putative endonuclease